MKINKEIDYNNKMMSIQSKFKFICQNYQKVLSQLTTKNKIIEQLNAKITSLQDNLDLSKKYATQLQSKIQKLEEISHMPSQKYIKPKLTLPQPIEYQQFQNKNYNSKLANLNFQSNSSIKDQLSNGYRRFNHLSPQPQKSTSYEIFKEEGFSRRLQQLKQKITTESTQLTVSHQLKFKDLTNTQFKSPKNLSLNNKSQIKITNSSSNFHFPKILNQNQESSQDIKTLHKIWQERDNQICKMDEIFQSINDKLKQYEHQNVI